ncbi:MAG TPA: hypothetical protein VN030_07085 [Cellvibrio sp.]|nr:hypothetical protein [Cellvibrio sp.]
MTEIFFCNQSLKAEALHSSCAIDIDNLWDYRCSKPDILTPYTPYFFNQNPTAIDRSIADLLSTAPVAKPLTDLSLSFGGDNTLALAEITQKLQDYNLGLLDASAGVYGSRMTGFTGAVKKYQEALIAYGSSLKSNAAARLLARQKTQVAFQSLQLEFKHELNAVTAGVNARRGTPLTNLERATNIARSSRNLTALDITSQVQANNLVKFSKHTALLGNGLAVIDFTSRIGNIYNSHQAGGNWQRELFIESSSFALSALAGTAIVNTGGAMLGFLVLATPIGWVGLLAGGLTVAGVAAATSIGINQITKEDAGGVYDLIMNKLAHYDN